MSERDPTPEQVDRSYRRILNQFLEGEPVPSDDLRAELDRLQHSCDAACHFGDEDGLSRVLDLAEALSGDARLSVAERAWVHYTQGNVWSELEDLHAPRGPTLTVVERPEREHAMMHYRAALALAPDGVLSDDRASSLLTNLGNTYYDSGRLAEAVACYDQAIGRAGRHGMALASRGSAWAKLGELCYRCGWTGQGAILVRRGRDELREALPLVGWPEQAEHWRHRLDHIESAVADRERFERPLDLDRGSLGDTPDEQQYRAWCLHERLFLNPFNELGPVAIAGHDCLLPPPVVTPLDVGPGHLGLFNQMKQEFAGARYLLWSGLTGEEPHYADREVALVNTLDYPAYGLRVEMMKLAFRSAYSLLDKSAFFLNRYLALGIPDKRVAFRTLWYMGERAERGIRPELSDRHHWFLQALFWLSKDLYDEGDWQECIEPDARELAQIRNHLEHKYLKLHDIGSGEERGSGMDDDWAHSMSRADFERKTVELLRRVRAALLYLCFAIHEEEAHRAASRPEGAIVPPMFLDAYEDEWKR